MTHSPSARELMEFNETVGSKRLAKMEYNKFMDGDIQKYRTATRINVMLKDKNNLWLFEDISRCMKEASGS